MNQQAKNWLITTLIIVLLVFLLFAVSWKKEKDPKETDSRKEGNQAAESLQSYLDEQNDV